MLAAMHLTPVGDLADVEPVLEQMGKRSDAETDASAPAAIATANYQAARFPGTRVFPRRKSPHPAHP